MRILLISLLIFSSLAGCGETNPGLSPEEVPPQSVTGKVDSPKEVTVPAVISSATPVPSATPNPTQQTGKPLPEPSSAAGQIVFTFEGAANLRSVSGYVVGKQDILRLEKALSGEFFIHNVPSGKYDVVVNAESPDGNGVGVRLSGVEAVNGARTKKENLELSLLTSISGKVKLEGEEENSGASVTIPGTNLFAKTDAKGDFILKKVPVGMHNVLIEKQGFSKAKFEGLQIEVAKLAGLGEVRLIIEDGMEGIILNSGEEISPSKSVSVTIYGVDDAVKMKVSENSDFSGSAWKPLRSSFVHSFETYGSKTLYVKVANADGSEYSSFNRSIKVESEAPIPKLSLRLQPPNCSSTVANLEISIPPGASTPTHMKLSTNGSILGAIWESFSPSNILEKSTLVGTVMVRLRDQFNRKRLTHVIFWRR